MFWSNVASLLAALVNAWTGLMNLGDKHGTSTRTSGYRFNAIKSATAVCRLQGHRWREQQRPASGMHNVSEAKFQSGWRSILPGPVAPVQLLRLLRVPDRVPQGAGVVRRGYCGPTLSKREQQVLVDVCLQLQVDLGLWGQVYEGELHHSMLAAIQ